MQKKYFDFHLKSLILNQLVFPGYKLINFKLLNKEKKNFLDKKKLFFTFILLLFPNKFLFIMKKNNEKNKNL